MTFRLSILLLLAGTALFSCQNDAKTEGAKTADKPKADTLKMPDVTMEGAGTFDIYEGQLNWVGKEEGLVLRDHSPR